MDELIFCRNKESEKDASFQKIILDEGSDWNIYANDSKIIFIEDGTLSFSFGEFQNNVIHGGYIFLLPANYYFSSLALKKCTITVLKMNVDVVFCDCFATQALINEDSKIDKSVIKYLPTNPVITHFLESISLYIGDGIRCPSLSEIKIKELFFLLMRYYSRADLYHFFFLHLTSDMSFSDAVLKNFNTVRNVKEFADALNYSISGFQKHFKKVFGISPYKWLLEQRSRSILHDIVKKKASFKEISDKYNFSSISHFYVFCHKQFGMTPSEVQKGNFTIRQEKKAE